MRSASCSIASLVCFCMPVRHSDVATDFFLGAISSFSVSSEDGVCSVRCLYFRECIGENEEF